MELSNEARTRRNATLRTFTSRLKARCHQEAAHAARVAVYSVQVGEAMGWDEAELLSLRYAAELHDIGKLHWPESYFQQETRVELPIVKSHPLQGARMISNVDWLKPSVEGVLYHHERWDGTGYPLGLKETKISTSARIIAVSEAFDSMTMPAGWNQTIPEKEAIEELKRGSGGEFDPDVVELFLQIQPIIQPVGL